jgi:uncharacterized integral membrane protein
MTDSPQDLEYEQVPSAADQPVSAGAQPVAEVPQAQPPELQLPLTRTSGLWVSIGCFAVVLLLLLIFILQNSHSVDVSYLGIHSHLPLGVAMLLAAVCGILLVVLAGTARILQLRATARRHRRADAQATKQAAKEARKAAKVTRPRTPADPGA